MQREMNIIRQEDGQTKFVLQTSLIGRVNDKRHEYWVKRLIELAPSYNPFNDAQIYLNNFTAKGPYYAQRINLLRTMRQAERSNYDLLHNRAAGSISALQWHLYDAKSSKSPANAALGQWVSVEIECLIPKDSLAGYDYDWDENKRELCKYMSENKIANAHVKHDGSLTESDDDFDCEIAIFIRVGNKEPLKKLCKLLASLDARVDKSCGLHVHLDQRDTMNKGSSKDIVTQAKQIVLTRAKRLEIALPVLLKMMPKSRRNNDYCAPMRGGFESGRYYAINLQSFSEHRTIEVRLHSGTVNYEKISNWIDLLYSISRNEKVDPENFALELSTPEEVGSTFGLDERLVEYMRERVRTFRYQVKRDQEDDAA